MCAHSAQQKWGRGLPVGTETSCLTTSSASGDVNQLQKVQLPQTWQTYACFHLLCSPPSAQPRGEVWELSTSWGTPTAETHFTWAAGQYVCGGWWWTPLAAGREQSSFSIFPVTSQHFSFAGSPRGRSSSVFQSPSDAREGLIAQATLVTCDWNSTYLGFFYLRQNTCELGPYERFKICPCIITEIPKNNYHAHIGKWLPSERELWQDVHHVCISRTWLMA